MYRKDFRSLYPPFPVPPSPFSRDFRSLRSHFRSSSPILFYRCLATPLPAHTGSALPQPPHQHHPEALLTAAPFPPHPVHPPLSAMTRHGKNCTAGAVYTYHEKRKDTGGCLGLLGGGAR